MEKKQMILEELATMAPNLKAIEAPNVYQVPDGYFDHVPEMVMVKIRVAEQAPVVSMRFARKWFTYAAAVMLTGILVTGAFLYSDKPSINEVDKYKVEDLSLSMDQVTDEELVSYLEENTNPSIEAVFTDHTELLPTTSVHLAQLSNERLDEYLLDSKHLVPNEFDEPLK